jgi:hypothetical protein
MRTEDGKAQTDAAVKKALAKAQKESKQKEIKTILSFYNKGVPISVIAKSFTKTEGEINEIIKKYRK